MNRTNSYILVSIILIIYYHRYIQNNIEKKISSLYFGYDNVKRPMSNDHMYTSRDLGMPSGHAEIATIVSCILYFYKYISLWVCILLIAFFSTQRIIANRHTVLQVIVGIVCGLLYSYIYIINNLSLLSFGIVVFIGGVLFLSILYIQEKENNKSVNNLDDNKTTISYLYEIVH
jgi:membrane-associated phospholipid phosphatase